MIFIDLLFAVILALLIAGLLVGLLGWRHPRYPEGRGTGAIFLFILLLAVIWTGGVWSVPYGPALWGSYWVPFLFIGLAVALLILAIGSATPRPGNLEEMPPDPTVPTEAEAIGSGLAVVFGFFFWVLLISAAIVVTIRYVD